MEGEQSLWDKEISRAIEKATGIIDLSYHNLGKGVINSIPPTIGDLSKLVVLPRHHASVIASPSPTESSSFIRPVQRTRALSRSVTLPASAFQASCSGVSPLPSPPRAATRTVSSSAFMEAAAAPWHNEIQLFLANNRIKTLPLELFNVTALTVLILRSNELVSIRPKSHG
ncbi:hypothetical protein A0H81_14769 [Grifola frondosa]|uniref:Uncharacterized protein n=1 Tax=Grifola frondosa TaxID=5627 RepID=A0A1C7LL52_GRIFR|nr:hypothetical protein A0H81_14769 [Grifola frondosa]